MRGRIVSWDARSHSEQGFHVVLQLREHDGDIYTCITVRLERSLDCRLWASTMAPDDGDDREDAHVDGLPKFWRVRAFEERWVKRLLEPLSAMLTRRSGRGQELVLRDDRVEL